MKIYAFDVDETLEISAGLVKLTDLVELRNQGHCVGICGNWAALTQRVENWWHFISFISNDGCIGHPDFKAGFLFNLKRYIPAEEYVMVGNILGVSGTSDDQGAAQRAGWRFIQEAEFAKGAR